MQKSALIGDKQLVLQVSLFDKVQFIVKITEKLPINKVIYLKGKNSKNEIVNIY